MLALQCTVCDHANPEDAKFCNACGSRLQIKICPHCEAVNDQSANACYQCGSEFPGPLTTPEAAARATGERLQLLLRNDARASPAAETSAFSPVASEGGFDLRSEAIAEPAVEHRDQTWRPPHSKSATAAAVVSVAVVSAIAITAYYVDQPAHLGELPNGTQRGSTTTHGLATSPTPTRQAAGERIVAPLSEPQTTFDGTGVAIEGPGPGSPVGTSTRATSAPLSVTSANASANALAAEPPPGAMRAATKPAVRTDSASTSESVSIRSAPSRSGPNVPPSTSLGIVCTEAIAAAGLCNLSRSEHDAPSNVAPASPGPSVCTEAIAAAGLCSPSPTQESR